MVLIADDGCGFIIDQTITNEQRPSWGLLGMRERASLLGGEVVIASHPGRGTTVTITIPYQSEVKNEVYNGYPTVTR